ncbi:MAG: MnhB domain-containing protein [Azonexus sp.]|nr:MnhB domain-containing protein [Azonexus sp.]MDZ4314282.1 MnhB domain-containing protein [Azonexus sp.]
MKKLLVILGGLIFSVALIAAMLDLGPAPIDLRLAVASQLSSSGADHPVTAVLLNFRGYDTLLEIAVLLLALIGILAIAEQKQLEPALPVDPLLQMLARIAAPLMLIVAVYLLWAGAHQPGGAFQAAAILASAAVLLHLVGLLPRWMQPGKWLRWGLVGGFLVFLGVAAALLGEGSLLQYPPALAGTLILLIESGLTVSLGLILAGLFLFLSTDGDPA